jgi:Rrf2 family protein
MRLNERTDYGLRVLLHLAARPGEPPRSAGHLARVFAVSESHLAKVIQALAAHGFVRTVPGRGGGVLLARPADEVRLGEVVRVMEPMSLAPCFAGDTSCPFLARCGLAPCLEQAWEAFLAVLDAQTLEQAARATYRVGSGDQAG